MHFISHITVPFSLHVLGSFLVAANAQIPPDPASTSPDLTRLACTTDACALALLPTPGASLSSSGLAACASWISRVVAASAPSSTTVTSTVTATVTGELSAATGVGGDVEGLRGLFREGLQAAEQEGTRTTTITTFVTDVTVRATHVLNTIHGYFRNVTNVSVGGGGGGAGSSGFNSSRRWSRNSPVFDLKQLKRRLDLVTSDVQTPKVTETVSSGVLPTLALGAKHLSLPSAYAGVCMDTAAFMSACMCLGGSGTSDHMIQTVTVMETMTRTIQPQARGSLNPQPHEAIAFQVQNGITASPSTTAGSARSGTEENIDAKSSETIAAQTGRLVLRSWPRFRTRSEDQSPVDGQYIVARGSRWNSFATLLQGTRSRAEATVFDLQAFGPGWALVGDTNRWVVAQEAWNSSSGGETNTTKATGSSSSTIRTPMGTASWSTVAGTHKMKRAYQETGRWNTSHDSTAASTGMPASNSTTASAIPTSTPSYGDRAAISALFMLPLQLAIDASMRAPVCVRRRRGMTEADMGFPAVVAGRSEEDADVAARVEELSCSQPNDESGQRRQALQYCRGDSRWLERNGYDTGLGYLALDEYVDRGCERVVVVFES